MNEQFISELAKTIVSIDSDDVAKDFLANILTPAELEEMSKRLQIVKLLHSGMPQREVAETLKVSIGTVSRGARELKYGAPGFKRIFNA